ncbi:hypothetical protein GCM10023189_24040 [Nibrella saemangeumensis]|uniref:Lipoprotein n=2 Tax=Nibrella saemangeumensis TaxID=1084526 RepID=A0ABP8MTE2_9BACT
MLSGILLLTGCEKEKLRYRFTIHDRKPLSYGFNGTGAFNGSASFRVDDLVDQLKRYDNPKIEKYTLRAVRVTLTSLSQGTGSIRLTGLYGNGTVVNPFFENLEISLDQKGSTLVNTYLKEVGVKELSQAIEASLLAPTRPPVLFQVQGTTIPQSRRVVFTMNLDLEYDLVYTRCIETNSGLIFLDDSVGFCD